jgi:hypothetical protein
MLKVVNYLLVGQGPHRDPNASTLKMLTECSFSGCSEGPIVFSTPKWDNKGTHADTSNLGGRGLPLTIIFTTHMKSLKPTISPSPWPPLLSLMNPFQGDPVLDITPRIKLVESNFHICDQAFFLWLDFCLQPSQLTATPHTANTEQSWGNMGIQLTKTRYGARVCVSKINALDAILRLFLYHFLTHNELVISRVNPQQHKQPTNTTTMVMELLAPPAVWI